MKSKIINIAMEIMRLIENSLTMSPIGEDIYYYKWWNMSMVVDKGLEIRSRSIPLPWWLLVAGRVEIERERGFLVARSLFI